MDRDPTGGSSSSAISPSVYEAKFASRQGVKPSSTSLPSSSQYGTRPGVGHSNAAEPLSTTVDAARGVTGKPAMLASQLPPPLTLSAAVTAETPDADTVHHKNSTSSSNTAAAATASSGVPGVRNGMYPASRRRTAPCTSYGSGGGNSLSGVGAATAATSLADGSSSHPVRSPLRAGASTSSIGTAASPHPSFATPSTSPTSSTQRTTHPQPRSAQAYQNQSTGDVAGPPQQPQPQQQQQQLYALNDSDNGNGSYYDDDAMGNQTQRALLPPQKLSGAVASNSNGGDDQTYPAYPPTGEYNAQGDDDVTDVDAANAAAYYQQYYHQYYQYQLYYQQQQHLTAAAGSSREAASSYGYAQTAAGGDGGGEGYTDGELGETNGTGEAGGEPAPTASASSPATSSFGGTFGQYGNQRQGGYYYNGAGENGNVGGAPSYLARGAVSGSGRGAAPYPATANAANAGTTTGNLVGDRSPATRDTRTVSRTGSAADRANGSSADRLLGYTGGGSGGPRPLSSNSYSSPHNPHGPYSSEYDSSATQQQHQQQQQYYDSYGNQAMAGGYGEYRPSGSGYGYNAGYYTGTSQQQQQQQRQQRQYQYPRGGSRNRFPQPTFASYGYAAPYQEQYNRGCVSADGISANARLEQQLQERQQEADSCVNPEVGTSQGAVGRTASMLRQPVDAAPLDDGGDEEKDARNQFAAETATPEETSSTTRTQPPSVVSAPATRPTSSAVAGTGESKSALRKKKKAAAAAAAVVAAAAAANAEEAVEEALNPTAGGLPSAELKYSSPPSRLTGRAAPDTTEAPSSSPVSLLGSAGAGNASPASLASAEGPTSQNRPSTQREVSAATSEPFASHERTSPAQEGHASTSYGVHERRLNTKECTAATQAKAVHAGEESGADERTTLTAHAKTQKTAGVTRVKSDLVDAVTPTRNSSNVILIESSSSSNGDLARSDGGTHGRSATSGNSPSSTQRFLRHSPLTQCPGAPFHAYLNGAMAGQAAHMQSLPPSTAPAAAGSGSVGEGSSSGGANNSAGAGVDLALSTTSLSTCSSQAIPAIYAPVQRLLTHRTASAHAEVAGEAAAQHGGLQGCADEAGAGDEGCHGSHPTSFAARCARTTAVQAKRGDKEDDGNEGDAAKKSGRRSTYQPSPSQRSGASALSRDLLCSAEATSLRVGETTSTPGSSPRPSGAGVRPHHMHLFAHHSQPQRPESPHTSGLPQHLHAYRHVSPSLQPAALSAATASTTSDPYVQSPGSTASLPPRSLTGGEANVGAVSSPPPLRGRGADSIVKPNTFSNHVTPTSARPSPLITATGESRGAAATMQQHQQHRLPYPSSPNAFPTTGGGVGGYTEASIADTAEVFSTGYDDVSAYSSGGGSGQRGDLVSPSYCPAKQQPQQQRFGGGGGSGRRGGMMGGYRIASSTSAGFTSSPVSGATLSEAAKAGQSYNAGQQTSPAMGRLAPGVDQLLQGPSSDGGGGGGGGISSGGGGSSIGVVGRGTPSPRGNQQGNNASGGGSGGSVHANSPQHNRYSPRNQYMGGGANSSASNSNAVQAHGGFPTLPRRPAYIYEHHTGQEVLLEEFHSAMGFGASSFGNVACLVNAFSPQVPIVSDLEFPCDEEQCQLLHQPAMTGGAAAASADDPGLSSPGVSPGQNNDNSSSNSHGSGVEDGPSLHLEDTVAPTLMHPPPRPSDVDRSHYWDFDGPAYCEPVITLKSIWQSFDSPFGCVVNLAEPIYPAPMRPAEDELVYTPLLSGFRIRFHPASPAYKRLAAIREVRRQRRREEGGVAGDSGGAETTAGASRDAAASSSYAEEDGVLTWSATDRPNNRNIILEQVTELARCDESYAELLTATSADVDHQSWVALMWQPVFCGGHSAKHSCGTFLAFYLLRAPRHLFVPFANKSEGAAMNSSWSSPVFRGDRAALSFDLWSLQRHYNVARWVPSPPMTHITTALSALGEEEDAVSSVSASRGRMSWEDGPVGCTSNTAESNSVSNNGDSRPRPREFTTQSLVEGGAAPTYVRVPLVGLIPNRCRSEVWFKAIHGVHRHPNAGGGGGGGGNTGDTFFYHAPLFLMVTALQLMCWDAFNEWNHKPSETSSSADNCKSDLSVGAATEDAGAATPAAATENDTEDSQAPLKKPERAASSDSVSRETQLENPLTRLVEQRMTVAALQQDGETGRGSGAGNVGTAVGQEGGSGGRESRPPAPPSAPNTDTLSWVSYFAKGVEVMTDAARRYRTVRELANLDALVEDGGAGAGAAALSSNAATISPTSAAARFDSESPMPSGAGNDGEEKRVTEEEAIRPVSCALVAGGTNSALCDPAARVIAGLLDYYQWAQYDVALSGLARVYCTM
jgi:hypothetical protein